MCVKKEKQKEIDTYHVKSAYEYFFLLVGNCKVILEESLITTKANIIKYIYPE